MMRRVFVPVEKKQCVFFGIYGNKGINVITNSYYFLDEISIYE